MDQLLRTLEVDASQFRESRDRRQSDIDAGTSPAFSAADEALRTAEWQVAAVTKGQQDPRILLCDVQSPEEARALAGELSTSGDRLVLRVDSLWGAINLEGIVHALRDRVVAMACAHDAYLYSFICTFQRYPHCILPDRSDMSSKTHFLSALSRHAVSIGRRRGVGVYGDGISDQLLAERGGQPVEIADLIQVPRGRITRQGIRRNILQVLDPGAGADAVNLACAQLWQWVRHETGVLDEGRIITGELFDELLQDEVAAGGGDETAASRSRILRSIVLAESFTMQAF
jgi:hypothetical protein